MKVNIPVQVDIDVDSWNLAYGTDNAKTVRADAKEYIQNLVRDHLNELELLVGEKY